MSGGSFNYAHSKLYELDSWADMLDDMAERCRNWSASDSANMKYVDGVDVPSTIEDRASILVRAMLLEKASKRLRGAIDEVKTLEQVMHDVEWVASSDYGVDSLMGPLK